MVAEDEQPEVATVERAEGPAQRAADGQGGRGAGPVLGRDERIGYVAGSHDSETTRWVSGPLRHTRHAGLLFGGARHRRVHLEVVPRFDVDEVGLPVDEPPRAI